jgi:hypothetical protein
VGWKTATEQALIAFDNRPQEAWFSILQNSSPSVSLLGHGSRNVRVTFDSLADCA